MHRKELVVLIISFFLFQTVYSQDSESYKWWNPANNPFPVIEGQGWHAGLANPYDRLPSRAKNEVRNAVWYLSEESAGLVVRFRSNASDILVKYKVERKSDMPHMPSTGVSGVDLYALNKEGNWEWAGGKYHFGDTIEYHFSSLKPGKRMYYLYLPLYNKVTWLEIGVPGNATLIPVSLKKDKPIVIYGTSIAQGGVASRPGMAWTAILGRRLHESVINLAFSGNGRLESSVTHFLTELDPKIYVIDCMPNMTGFMTDTIELRLRNTITALRQRHPEVPILIVEDADANIHSLDQKRDSSFNKVNKAADIVFNNLKKQGMRNIYLLTAKSIGLNIESTVDGVHPNDYGMELYAKAYETIIKEIFRKNGNK